MSWKEVSIVSQRQQFFELSQHPEANISQLCRLFKISRKTGYKWINRGLSDINESFKDLSKRPHCSPNQTPPILEKEIVRRNNHNFML